MKKSMMAVAGLLAAPALAQTPPVLATPPGAQGGAPTARANGIETRAGVTVRVQRMFGMLDTNKDGVIDQSEIAAMQARMTDGANSNDGGPRPGGGMMGRMLSMVDANGDGRITMQEATDAMTKRFDMADANHDGQVTPDERAAARERMRAMRGDQ